MRFAENDPNWHHKTKFADGDLEKIYASLN